MLTPFLEAFRRNVPKAKSHWWSEAGVVSWPIFFNAVVLSINSYVTPRSHSIRARETSWGSAKSCCRIVPAWRLLRKRRFDLFVDMRPYFPCAWLLAILSGAKVRAGFGLRGMSDAFHFILPYSASKRLGQIYLDALPSITGAGLIYGNQSANDATAVLVNAFRLPSDI